MCTVPGCPFRAITPCPDPEHGHGITTLDRARARFAARIAASLPDAAAPVVVVRTYHPGSGRPGAVHLAAVGVITRASTAHHNGGIAYARQPGELIGINCAWRHAGHATVRGPSQVATCPKCIAAAERFGIEYPGSHDHVHHGSRVPAGAMSGTA